VLADFEVAHANLPGRLRGFYHAEFLNRFAIPPVFAWPLAFFRHLLYVLRKVNLNKFKQSWRQTSNWNKLMVLLTTVVAASTAVYTFYARKQFMAMNGQLAEMRSTSGQTEQLIRLYQQQLSELHKQASDTHELALQAKNQADMTRLVADRAFAQAEATHKLADEAERSGDIAIGSNEANVRAWLTVNVGEKTGTFAISMHNTGKSPALNVTYVSAFTSGRRGAIPSVDLSRNSSSPISVPDNAPKEFLERLARDGYIRGHPPTGFVIAPDATEVASDYQGKFLQIFRMAGDRAYVQGRVTYDDIFGKSHQTTFCYRAELPQTSLAAGTFPASDFIMCNDHNSMD
jgi:hypothetical protein